MRQKHRIFKNTGIVLAVFSILVVIPSCIDELYDLKNGLSSDMALGGDSLSLPLGSTDSIKLRDFLNEADVEMLKTMEDGGYGLTMKDSMDVDVPKIDQSALKIDDQTFSQSKSISFGDISLEDFKIPGVTVNSDINLSLSSISLGNFAIPAISKQESFSAGMSDYALTNPTINNLTVDGGKDNLFAGITLPPDPGIDPPQELTISDPDPVSFNSSTNVPYSIDVPDGVTGIDRIELSKSPTKAVFEVSIEVAGASGVLTAGSIIPDITLDPSDLFEFEVAPSGNRITFGSSEALNASNGYKQTKTLNINAFKITETPSGGKLNISKTILSSGSMRVTGARVMSNNVSKVRELDLIVSVSIKNVVIESMDFNIPTLQTNISGNTPFSIDNTIPSEINKVNKVLFNSPAKIAFDLQALHLPTMISKTITLDQLSITFPDKFVFESGQAGLSGHTYTLLNENFDPVAGRKIELNLKELDMSGIPLTGGKLTWNDGISYTGKVSFKGRINSKNIPTSAANDTKMSVDVASSLSFKSAEVTTNDILKALPVVSIPISFNVNIAKQVKSLGVINLVPGTKIRVDITKPLLPLALRGDNIQITFPPIFSFKTFLPSNTYIINGAIPDYIELELASLNINKPLLDGKLTLNENIGISGGVKLLAGEASSADIDALSGKKMSLVAATTDLAIAPTTIQLNTLEATFADTTDLNVVINDLPAEIISLDSIILDDNATLELSVDLTNVPDLSKPLMADMTLDFPDLLRFAPGAVNTKNQLIINQAFVDGKLNKTIGIKGLHFDGKNLNGKLSINEKVGFNGNVSVQEPTVNSTDLNSNPINVKVDVKLAGIKFKSVYGQVNPGIDPVTTNVELSDIPEFMKGEDVVLDISRPVIDLETQSNLEIPINATMTLTPLKKGATIGEAKTLMLKMPKASSSSVYKTTHYWIAPDSAGMPQHQNYRFVESDIQTLFRTVPDEIKFIVDAQASPEEQHHIDLNAVYNMKVKYDVTVPMAFGKDLMIEIRDTISDLDESIGDIAFSGKGLELYGNILNSIPLELELKLIPLDGDNNHINVVIPAQLINAGAHDGSAVSSILSIKIKDPDGLMKDVRGFELIFKATSNETVAGTPIKPDNFVKADLKVHLNGGIKISDK